MLTPVQITCPPQSGLSPLIVSSTTFLKYKSLIAQQSPVSNSSLPRSLYVYALLRLVSPLTLYELFKQRERDAAAARNNDPNPESGSPTPQPIRSDPTQPQPHSDVFVDPGPWYPWKADTAWYEPHPSIQDYRLHEKWFPGAPTPATHPHGQNGGVIKDDGKTYPPSMFVEGRPDLEFFGMGVDPPETKYESVGTVATAHHFHSDELWAGFDKDANDELDSLGRPLPFITVFEDEIVALVEEFLWRRRRARWLGRRIPSLDPPLEGHQHFSSPTTAPNALNLDLSSETNAWNTGAEPHGVVGEQGDAGISGSASGAPVPGQSECQQSLL